MTLVVKDGNGSLKELQTTEVGGKHIYNNNIVDFADFGKKDDAAANGDTADTGFISLFKRLLTILSSLLLRGSISLVSDSSFSRPANTTAYTSDDFFGPAAPASQSLADVALSNSGTSAVKFIITSNNTSNALLYRLHIYSAAVTTAKTDNAAWALDYANDKDKYLGFVDFPAMRGGVAVSEYIDFKAAGSTSLFYELQVLISGTPASGETVNVRAVCKRGNG